MIWRGLRTSEINFTLQGAWQISVGCWLQACFYESQVHVPKYKEILIEIDFCVRIQTMKCSEPQIDGVITYNLC